MNASRLTVIFVVCLSAASGILGAEKTVMRQTNLREGPGAYYEIVIPLPRGSRINTDETRGNWVSGRVSSSKGWVPKTALDKPLPGIDYSGMTAGKDIKVISSVDIAAGTKGAFLTAYSEKHKLNMAVVGKIDDIRLDPSKVQLLAQDLTPMPQPVISSLPRIKYEHDLVVQPDAETLLGKALVAHVAQRGLIENEAVLEYVNEIAAIVGSQTERYDLCYKVAVVNDPSINGFGLPGGYIVLTRGLLKSINSESELAFVLGHEIAHTSLFHGLREFEKRDTHRKSDSAFAELDNITGSEESEIESDLRQIADKAYLKIIGERARGDESEADLFGLAYAASAGYSPDAAVSILARIEQNAPSGDTFRHHPAIDVRLGDINKAISKYRLKNPAQKELADRYKKKMESL